MLEEFCGSSLFILSAIVACLSWTIAKSLLFQGLRRWIQKKSKFLGKLVGCPYCLSHYISAFVAIGGTTTGLFDLMFVPQWLSWIILTFLLVWLAAFQWSLIALIWKFSDL